MYPKVNVTFDKKNLLLMLHKNSFVWKGVLGLTVLVYTKKSFVQLTDKIYLKKL